MKGRNDRGHVVNLNSIRFIGKDDGNAVDNDVHIGYLPMRHLERVREYQKNERGEEAQTSGADSAL